ncbi:glycosyltransferase family 2 protein [Novipirellula caenicola]|uniref:glycosyltransferase n=1 Tax=Novipirellula caenicola TaxID=1536901 RepID=UPI0031E85ABA
MAIQTGFTLAFAAIMFRKRTPANPAYTPKAAILLCLRGADPFLEQCIARLLDQDYPDYELHVVVDSLTDPAQTILQAFESNSRLHIHVLNDPAESCSLKCSSIVQAIRELDPSFEVIALCDADSTPHRTWLAELVAPLARENVGATTGNRWYDPPTAAGGSIVRYLWNVPTAINMILLRIAWGGSLAIRRCVIDETGLLEKWSTALCEDTMLFSVLRRHGYRQVFVPSVLMVNRESCTFGDLMQWIPRQLLTAKLYHPSWPATVGYGIISVIVPFLAVALVAIGVVQSDVGAIRAAVIVFVGFELSNLLLVGLCQWAASRQIASSRVMPASLGLTSWTMLPVWIVLAQLISPLTFFKCFVTKTISWRGIEYRIRGRQIQRGTYSPYRESAMETQSL